MVLEPSRRTLLRTSSVLLGVGLPGCVSRSRSGTTTNRPQTEQPSITNRPQTGQPSTTERTSPSTYRHDDWKYVLAGARFTTSFRLRDDDSTHEMPPDKQLLVVRMRITNYDASPRIYSGGPYVAVTPTGLVQETHRFSHPDFESSIPMEQLEGIDHAYRYRPNGYRVHAEATIDSWLLFVLPRAVARTDVQIGFQCESADSHSCETLWNLAAI